MAPWGRTWLEWPLPAPVRVVKTPSLPDILHPQVLPSVRPAIHMVTLSEGALVSQSDAVASQG